MPRQGEEVTKIWCMVSWNLNSSAVIQSDTSSALSQAQESARFAFEPAQFAFVARQLQSSDRYSARKHLFSFFSP